jgi:hypothetical protein
MELFSYILFSIRSLLGIERLLILYPATLLKLFMVSMVFYAFHLFICAYIAKAISPP